ncbi:uncharacterized protein LOC104880290 [Vitis vinifera]|uniref:uncharacterized protein LOC104880290 n=1 Tax=Vitis vinifera TaxID=29760 RepID=UPI00053FBB8F|nr:uncharacterized protein LOC104880290 [Vitis vinifera]|eukprot:XP_010654880.1 PREDICTED: zonadhesin-like [Vitis vinifera]
MTTRGVPSPTSIHFTIDGRHGILEVRDIAEALHIPFEPLDPSAFRRWSPQYLRRTWSLAGYFAPPGAHLMVAPPKPLQTEHAQSTPVPTTRGELPTETKRPAPASPTSAPPVPMPEAVSAAPPMTPTVPSVAPTTSKPSITISALKFRGLIQQHLGLLLPPQPNLPTSSKPLATAKDTIPAEDTTTVEVQIPPPQEATTDAIASVDPQDKPQTIDTVTTIPEDASSPPEAPTT